MSTRPATRLLRFATLNVNCREENSPAFAQVMNEHSVDVFCLNECTPTLARNVFQRSECCGFTYAAADFAGNALFSRFPIINRKALITTPSNDIETRSASVATILVDVCTPDNAVGAEPLSVELTLMGMHLSHFEESDRLAEFKELTKEVSWTILYEKLLKLQTETISIV